ncbi:MAG: ribosome-associated translation inhibitor RaiA, partial [Chloroflexi bacterium]|nr:ribosome-associated translation inhibitor RaiA [Chloroflexota bacterium]
MEIVVRSKNVTVTERVQEYVEKKIGKLERYLPIIDEARMELSQEE